GLGEQTQDGLELVLERLQRFAIQRGPRRRLERTASRAPMLVDLPARPVDRVLLGVEEMLDEEDQLDLTPLIDAIAGAILRRAQEPELALPIPEHVRLQIRQRAHIPDRIELPSRLSRHQSDSARNSRSMSSAIDSRAGFPSNRILWTPATIGMSTPTRSANLRALRAVVTPSATVSLPTMASASVAPWPTATPSARFRLKAPVQVRTRSPMPARPANVAP